MMDKFGVELEATNIHNELKLPYKKSTCVGHLQCPNNSCEYLSRNDRACNNTKWFDTTPVAFVVDKGPSYGSMVQCKVCHSLLICFIICHAKTTYTHFASFDTSHVCIHLGVNDYHALECVVSPWA